MSRSPSLGEFEELVMLTVGLLYDEAYAVAVTEEIIERTGRSLSVSAVHQTLYRLEKKGMLSSRLDNPEPVRGGKRKRIFNITLYGKNTLDDSLKLRNALRNEIPDLAFKS